MKRLHFIGIGGIGMSALARIALQSDVTVSGSDIAETAVVDQLRKEGASIFLGHAKEVVPDKATVVYSSDIKSENPEFVAAKEKGCLLLHRSELLAHLMKGQKVLAVTGTHGKTSTSALLAHTLVKSGEMPSYAVGGILLEWGSNGARGKGDFFVAEADESDGSFLNYTSHGAIITNIDNDHMSHWGSMEALKCGFQTFVDGIENKKLFFYCGDDPYLKEMQLPGISYGVSCDCDWQLTDVRCDEKGVTFTVVHGAVFYRDITLTAIGRHQALNALAVFALCRTLGVDEDLIRSAFATFRGVARRCEKKIDRKGFLLLDDYGHHPTEVAATLGAIKEQIGDRRLIVAFQPHRYTRTKDCLHQFGPVFRAADELFVTDLYAAGEKPIPDISTEVFLEEVKSEVVCEYVPRDRLAEELFKRARSHDVVVTMGAGDITKVGGELALLFKKKPLQKLAVGVVTGGRSSEHEVALQSAEYVLKALDPDLYDVQRVDVSKEGVWSHEFSDLLACDLFIPVMHGPCGEDGMVQGFFETLQKAYVGCDYRACAVAMDKGLLKRLAMTHDLPVLPFVELTLNGWREGLFERIENLKWPLFVKPVHLGSSIGVSKVERPEELIPAIERAFYYDTQVIIEQGVKIREIEFAVLGKGDRPDSVFAGEVDAGGSLLDYLGKYGVDAKEIIAYPDIDEKILQKGLSLARKAYEICGCYGLARVDTFLDEKGHFWLNEINPFPGMTKTSLYPIVMESRGVTGAQLIDRLIILALHRQRFQKRHYWL